MMKYPIIHLWSPYAHHEESFVVANRAGLLELKKAVDIACEEGKAITNVFTSDGEGYHLHIIITEDDEHIALPYTADYARESAGEGRKPIFPWDMIK